MALVAVLDTTYPDLTIEQGVLSQHGVDIVRENGSSAQAIASVAAADQMVRRGEWGLHSSRPVHLPSASVAGVLRLGRIGRRTAELFAAVGFGRVIGHDPWVRGSLIDNQVLAAALTTGRPRIAALDVFVVEPPDLSEFSGVEDRLILSPHQAWYTEESQADLRRKSAEETLRVIKGEPPLNPVTLPSGDARPHHNQESA